MDKPTIECYECNGDGNVESVYPECTKAASICCGGCYKKYECELCDGSGYLIAESEDLEDYFRMVNAYEKMVDGFKEILKGIRALEVSFSEDAYKQMEYMLEYKYIEEANSLRTQIRRIEKHIKIIMEEIKKYYAD